MLLSLRHNFVEIGSYLCVRMTLMTLMYGQKSKTTQKPLRH